MTTPQKGLMYALLLLLCAALLAMVAGDNKRLWGMLPWQAGYIGETINDPNNP